MSEPSNNAAAFAAHASRPASAKFNRSWIVMLLSGLVAFVMFFAATSQNKSSTPVYVAKRAIAQGETYSPSDFERVDVRVPGAAGSTLLIANSASNSSLIGKRASRPLVKGSIVLRSDFADLSQENGKRWVSFDAEQADAIAGDLKVNDEIDLFNKCGDQFGYRLKVVSVNRASSGGLGSSTGKLTIKVATDDGQVNDVVRQTLAGRIKVVMNNGRPDLRIKPIPACSGVGGK